MSDVARRVAIASTVGLLAAAAVVVAATRSDDPPNEGVTESSADRAASESSTKRWRRLRPSPLERTEVAAARIGKRIYVVGGFERSTGQSTGAVARYDIKRDRWKRVKPLPIAINHGTATARRGRLYVHGGFTSSAGLSGATARLYSYSPKRNRWKRLADSPTPRAAHALGTIGGKLYAAGGADDTTGQLTSLEIYDISARKWTSGADMSVGRNHVGATVAGRQLYVLGGRAGPREFNVVERYDPRSNAWKAPAPLRTARSGFAAVTVRGKVIAFGGEELGPGGTTIEQVERYNPGTDTWTALPDMRTPRHGLGGVSRKRRVFALEGGPQPGFAFSDLVEFLDVPKR